MIKFYRAIKTALQYMARNFGLSFATVTVMTLSLFIVSVVGLAFYGSYKLVKYIDAKPALTVFLRGDLDEQKAKEFVDIVNGTGLANKVDVNNIQYSKDELTKYNPDLKDDIDSSDDVVLPIITFIYANSQDDLSRLISKLENNESFMNTIVDRKNIDKVSWYKFNKDQAEVLKDTNKLLRSAGLGITIFLFVISSILVYITIKLTIHYHRRELEIMDLVGAERWFVKVPFVIDGLVYGVMSGLLAMLFLVLFKSLLLDKSQGLIPQLSNFFADIQWPALTPMLILQMTASLCLIGGLLGAFSSTLATFRYVKK